ncbi:MAG: family 78 glycoside hydrolase catalytic domain [Prevotellaceae bacterium]|jgi:alpha-L-rhamnosidase|nr:family 78 glycoside hydrolase catalytic domain [Prevotellaceae bacterium]
MKKSILWALLLGCTAPLAAAAAPAPQNLRCEQLRNPEGVGTPAPRFSWELADSGVNVVQLAYQLLVASTADKLAAGEGDVWQPDEQQGTASVLAPYGGAPLAAGADFFWKVKVRTSKGESAWSEAAHFSTGLWGNGRWQAQWVGLDSVFPWDSETQWARLSARYLRKEFAVEKKKPLASAKLFIAGMGLYELYLNGQRVGEQVLAPSPTDYRRAVIYNTFDVTPLLCAGQNAVGVALGNGRFYAMRQRYKPHKWSTFGYPKLLLQLELTYADGSRQTVASDPTWRITTDGPIRANNEYDGETYDATKEMPGWSSVGFKDKSWLKAAPVAAPAGKLAAQATPNMKVMEVLAPRAITPRARDTFIVDMGQNMAGWVKIRLRGAQRGDTIRLHFAETLNPDGSLYTRNLRDARCTDTYIARGGGEEEEWQPAFVYHGFRYVQLTGFATPPTPADVEGMVVYDEMETTGTFECSSDLLNRLHRNAYWGIRANYKGMPVDCPQRNERQPWLGDRATGALGESYIFGNATLYAKWLGDIEEAQRDNGAIPDVAPAFWNYYSDNMTWPGAYLLVADMLRRQAGDALPIRQRYPSMKRWLGYMRQQYMTPEGIVTKDKYGDWCVPPEEKELVHSRDSSRRTDGQLIATAYYYKMATLMADFARLADSAADAAGFAEQAAEVRKAFNQKFYNPQRRCYDNNTVTANLLPLAFGMVERANEEAVLAAIVAKIMGDNKGHLSTGLVGTGWLLRELSRRGRTDVAYTIATQTDYPSWGYMLENGATTIWELWNGNTANPSMNSHNHVMLLGDLIAWMYEDLAGLRAHPAQAGFKFLWMHPRPTETLTWAKASHRTPYGVAASEWRLEGERFTWRVTIPAGARANLLVPAPDLESITANGKPAMQLEGAKFVRVEQGRVNLELGSGAYLIECPYGEAQNRWKKGVLSQRFLFEQAPFPENHAATLAHTAEGKLMAAWFGGTKERNPDVCIYTSTLDSGGWTAPRQVASGVVSDTLRYACWNPVLYQAAGGELQLYYKVGPNVAGWQGKVIRSASGGRTWSAPEDLPKGTLGPIKNKPVATAKGTLVAGSSTEGEGGWRVHFELSRSKGKTWTATPPVADEQQLSAIQPCLLTYPDGRLQALCRSKSRAIVETWSADGGKTWSPLAATALPNNNSGFDAVTLLDGRQLLVYNHVLPDTGARNGKGARSPLNVALSDDGKTWYAAAVLEDSPIGQYSYPAVIQTPDSMVHIAYTWRRQRIKYARIDPRRLALSRIDSGAWPQASETEKVQVVNNQRYKVSVCDWMMLKRQKIGAVALAAELGADGLEVDMGSLGKRVSFDNKFTQKPFQQMFIADCNKLGVEFSSLALSAFYGQSFATRDNYESLVDEAIASMVALGIKRAFLPMGTQSDLTKNPELYPVVLARLRVLARKAEQAGVVFGIETALDARGEAQLIDEVGSPAVRSYVNFSSILKRKGDIVAELKTLGKERIMQIHATNTDGHQIQHDPQLDMAKVKATLDQMGWSGWLVIERSRDTTDVHNVRKNYGANVRYLKEVFQ